MGNKVGLGLLGGLLATLAEPAATTDNGPRPAISMPTAAVAVLQFPGDWPSLTPGQARLVSLTIPADLKDEHQ